MSMRDWPKTIRASSASTQTGPRPTWPRMPWRTCAAPVAGARRRIALRPTQIVSVFARLLPVQSIIEGLPAQDMRSATRTSLAETLEKRFKINNLRDFPIRDIIRLDRSRDGAHVIRRQPQLGLSFEPLIRVPAKPAGHLAQLAPAERLDLPEKQGLQPARRAGEERFRTV